MQNQTNQETRAKIQELRERFNKLKATCGLRHINQATISQYSKEIELLNQQLKGGDIK